MKIAVCDNNETILKKIASLIEDYIEIKHMDLSYKTFTAYEALVDNIESFDLFILDYNMNDDSVDPLSSGLMTGMDFAKLVRSKADPHKGVIFITSYTDIVYESFEVRTHRFLTKPIDRDKFFKALDDFFSTTIESGTIFVKIGNQSYAIPTDSIYYFEVTRKDVDIHYTDGVLTCHKAIGAFEDELTPFGFFRTHRSYLVNISKIKSLNIRSAIMKNNDEVYVSKKNYSALREAFLDNK